jgi:hypothetical protein
MRRKGVTLFLLWQEYKSTHPDGFQYGEWPVDFGDSGYVALYRYDGETALIVAVRHQKEAGYY